MKLKAKKQDQEQPVTLTCPSCKGQFPGWAVHAGSECMDCHSDSYMATANAACDTELPST